jgi:hypothetical protein
MAKTNKQPETAADAETTLARFEQERSHLLDRQRLFAGERRNAAYDAHTGDVQAAKRLQSFHDEAVRLASTLAGIDDAIIEAKHRVEAARQHEAKQADRERAAAQRKSLARFVAAGGQLDEAATLLAPAGQDFMNAHAELTASGIAFPRGEQLDVLGFSALQAMLAGTPWRRRFETISPVNRKRFGDLTSQWAKMIERQIAERLGEKEEADAA